jgi:hypothetical protein
MLDQKAGERQAVPAVGQPPRRLVAGGTVVGEDFRGRFALVDIGLGVRHCRYKQPK